MTDQQTLPERVRALSEALEHWIPQHTSSCAGQDDDAPCICGTSEVYVAALALASSQEPSLDAVWKAAETAIDFPVGHRLHRYGDWRLTVRGPWHIRHFEDSPVTYQAVAEPYNATGAGDDHEIEALGRTPAAALQALATRLSQSEGQEPA